MSCRVPWKEPADRFCVDDLLNTVEGIDVDVDVEMPFDASDRIKSR